MVIGVIVLSLADDERNINSAIIPPHKMDEPIVHSLCQSNPAILRRVSHIPSHGMPMDDHDTLQHLKMLLKDSLSVPSRRLPRGRNMYSMDGIQPQQDEHLSPHLLSRQRMQHTMRGGYDRSTVLRAILQLRQSSYLVIRHQI
jgi:hypothetical protein